MFPASLAPSLALQTRQGNDIQNEQYRVNIADVRALGRLEKGSQDFRNKYPKATERSDFCTLYNCHGMTFAARRTGIYASDSVRKIIEEDGYLKINEQSHILPGDVVIYFDSDGDIEHSGIVVSISSGNLLLATMMICSKWGALQEFIHGLYDCPYTKQNIEFYRLGT